jgi:dihydrofolate reductase
VREIKLFIASSLHGYIARENGDVSWLFSDEDYGYKEFYDSIDTVIMGRKTFEKALQLEEQPFKEKKCFIFTKNSTAITTFLHTKDENNIEFIDNVIEFVKNLVNYNGKDIWLVGGADIISVLINAKMVNEIILSIHPIILGNGIPLFKDIKEDVNLKVINSFTFKSGLMLCCITKPI